MLSLHVLAACVAAVEGDVFEDHTGMLQSQRVVAEGEGENRKQEMFNRAGVSGVAAALDEAVAGKKKCDAVEAQELITCVKVGNMSVFDLLQSGGNLNDAVRLMREADPSQMDCEELRSDMACMQNNPCWNKKVKHIPRHKERKAMKKLCSTHADVKILEDNDLTWKGICDMKVKDMCETLHDTIDELQDDYEECQLTCTSSIKLEAKHDKNAVWFVRKNRPGQTCEGKLHEIKTEQDCLHASQGYRHIASGETGHNSTYRWTKRNHVWTYEFKAIRNQKKPKGCYWYNNKIYWNSVRTGLGPPPANSGRIAICVLTE